MQKTPIAEIPIEFVLSNMPQGQRELMELKYYIFNRFNELREQQNKKLDIYFIISEEIHLQPDTINKICNGIVERLITCK